MTMFSKFREWASSAVNTVKNVVKGAAKILVTPWVYIGEVLLGPSVILGLGALGGAGGTALGLVTHYLTSLNVSFISFPKYLTNLLKNYPRISQFLGFFTSNIPTLTRYLATGSAAILPIGLAVYAVYKLWEPLNRIQNRGIQGLKNLYDSISEALKKNNSAVTNNGPSNSASTTTDSSAKPAVDAVINRNEISRLANDYSNQPNGSSPQPESSGQQQESSGPQQGSSGPQQGSSGQQQGSSGQQQENSSLQQENLDIQNQTQAIKQENAALNPMSDKPKPTASDSNDNDLEPIEEQLSSLDAFKNPSKPPVSGKGLLQTLAGLKRSSVKPTESSTATSSTSAATSSTTSAKKATPTFFADVPKNDPSDDKRKAPTKKKSQKPASKQHDDADNDANPQYTF